MQIQGRTWVFGDNINTDLMYPTAAFKASDEERARLVFSATRPGWSESVRDGDIIVAGSSFGTGSGRPAPRSLRALGIRGVVADSINGLFFRNSINYGLPAMECPGISAVVTEGETIEVDFSKGTVRVLESNETLRGPPVPEFLLEIVSAGGILQRLQAQGYV